MGHHTGDCLTKEICSAVLLFSTDSNVYCAFHRQQGKSLSWNTAECVPVTKALQICWLCWPLNIRLTPLQYPFTGFIPMLWRLQVVYGLLWEPWLSILNILVLEVMYQSAWPQRHSALPPVPWKEQNPSIAQLEGGRVLPLSIACSQSWGNKGHAWEVKNISLNLW